MNVIEKQFLLIMMMMPTTWKRCEVAPSLRRRKTCEAREERVLNRLENQIDYIVLFLEML